jgi:hypothetical protein
MVSGVRGKGLGGEKLVDLKFVRALLGEESFQHHRFAIRNASCVHA